MYLPNLRDNAYRYLLELERSNARDEIGFEVLDIDKDGYDELKVVTKNISAVFSSKYGGQMMEFGSFDTLFNWQNTLMRRYEAYHEKILHSKELQTVHVQRSDEISTIHSSGSVGDKDLKSELIYDWHPKYSFIEHLCTKPLTQKSFKELLFKDIADFANQPYTLDKKRGVFNKNGALYLDTQYATQIKKEYSFEENGIFMKLQCQSEYPNVLYFAQEFNFHFAHPNLVMFNAKTLENGFCEYNCKELLIRDDFTNKILSLKMNRECTILGYILNTVSQSESGFNKMAQGISFVLMLPFSSKLKWSVKLELTDV